MFSPDELPLRYEQPDEVENKEIERRKIERQTIEFECRGGKIDVIPVGVKTLVRDLPTDAQALESGYPGINWSADREEWVVRTPNSRRHIGYAPTIIEALKMQDLDKNKQEWKEY